MLRAMDAASRLLALGSTEICWSSAGHNQPSTTVETISRDVAIAGTRRSRRSAPATNAAAQIAAMHARMTFAGSSARRSV
jgi:hypothetical protein